MKEMILLGKIIRINKSSFIGKERYSIKVDLEKEISENIIPHHNFNNSTKQLNRVMMYSHQNGHSISFQLYNFKPQLDDNVELILKIKPR